VLEDLDNGYTNTHMVRCVASDAHPNRSRLQ
jgi:hypothetical protein